MAVGGICGSFSINVIAAKIGRKRGLYVSMGLDSLGSALAAISYYVWFSFSNFLLNLSVFKWR